MEHPQDEFLTLWRAMCAMQCVALYMLWYGGWSSPESYYSPLCRILVGRFSGLWDSSSQAKTFTCKFENNR